MASTESGSSCANAIGSERDSSKLTGAVKNPSADAAPAAGGHNDLANPKLARNMGAVHRSRPTHGDDGKIAWIAALFDNMDSGRAGHVFTYQIENPPGGNLDADIKPVGDDLQRVPRPLTIEGHFPAEERRCIKKAQCKIRIRDSGRGPAQRITGRARRGAGAIGAHLEQAELVHPTNGSTARADLYHVDHRRMDRYAAAPLEAVRTTRFEHRRHVRLAITDEARLGRRSTHVEREHIALATLVPDPGPCLGAAGRAAPSSWRSACRCTVRMKA